RATLTTQGLERVLYGAWSMAEKASDSGVVSDSAYRRGSVRACGVNAARVSWGPGERRKSSNRALPIRGLGWSVMATARRQVVSERRGQLVANRTALPNSGVQPTACAVGKKVIATGALRTPAADAERWAD